MAHLVHLALVIREHLAHRVQEEHVQPKHSSTKYDQQDLHPVPDRNIR